MRAWARAHLTDGVFCAGVAVCAVGLGMVYVPAALIFTGVALSAGAYFLDRAERAAQRLSR